MKNLFFNQLNRMEFQTIVVKINYFRLNRRSDFKSPLKNRIYCIVNSYNYWKKYL